MMQRKMGEPGAADPDVVVPRAVREAANRATQAQKDTYGVAEPPVIAAQPTGDQVPNGTPQPPAVTVPPATPPQGAPEPEDWEQKYKTLHGRYEADRKRQRESIDTMSNRVQQLERQLLMQPQPVATPATPPVQILTADEMNDYGEDFVNVVKRIAAATAKDAVQPIASEVQRTRAQVGVTQNQSMHQQMDTLFPQWREMNNYPPFIDWVLLPDPYSGVTRQRLMQEAWNTGDAHRVAAFMQGFVAEEAALNPQGNGSQPPAPAPAAPPPNGAPAPAPPLTLQSLAAPGGARSAQPPPAEKPTYTSQDISKFFTDCAAGKWRHREQERAAIEADIFQAQHEGRVVSTSRYTPPQPPRGFTQ